MKGTPLTDETFNYIVELFASEESDLLRTMAKRAAAAGMPMIMISEEQAKFVGVFLKAIKAKSALDVGTLFGYSAAIMARAMGADSNVVSLEFEPKHAEVARENLKELGLGNVVVHVGPALEEMKKMAADSFDFIMIDADKPNYVNYLAEALRLVRPGGVIAGDNALAWGKIGQSQISASDPDYKSVTSIQAFNRAFASEKAIFGVITPVGDGLALGVVEK